MLIVYMNITSQVEMEENLFFRHSRSDITINESVNWRESGSDLGIGLITCINHNNASDL